MVVPFKTGGQILAVWSANASAVYMGFSGTPQTLANVTSANPLQTNVFFDDVFSTRGNGSFDAAASDPFRGLLGAPGQNGLLSVTSSSLQPHCKIHPNAYIWCKSLYCRRLLLYQRREHMHAVFPRDFHPAC